MPIVVTCPCGKQLRARDDLAGRTAKCPNCHRELTIPAADEPVATAQVLGDPFWSAPDDPTVIGLDDKSLYATNLDEAARRQAEQAVAGGEPVAAVLETADHVIPLDQIQKVASNL